ncbi:hybrid sensor histidine kinase/response regulator [Sphingomicrobium clamense]|uniref:histidine kinase n=1 Tax=Sphingomicrobium clamense TaxID=2851013 RepID=A0ABS6V613_9SPHN|nr:response regulator [Sphingomicrobium sp. B8]MBW0145003.1 response regulator [Sphingomicrobium sp. B8]
MLERHTPLLEALPEDEGSRWLVPGLTAAAVLSGAVLLLAAGKPLIALGFVAFLLLVMGIAWWIDRRDDDGFAPSSAEVLPLTLGAPPDLVVVAATMALTDDAAALTDGEGRAVSLNPAWRKRFGSDANAFDIVEDEKAREKFVRARDKALREGEAVAQRVGGDGPPLDLVIRRVGDGAPMLLLHVRGATKPDLLQVAAKRIAGATGSRLANAGVLAALVDDRGYLLAANKPFSVRAVGERPRKRPRFSDLVSTTEDGLIRLNAEGENGSQLRAVHVPIDPSQDGGAGTLLMFEGGEQAGLATSDNVQVLLEMLPLGLALVDRDGRFLTMNGAFRTAAGIGEEGAPSYPGDLVVKEDKGAVADAVRRHVRGPSMSADLAVRLSSQPKEPVALTVAGLRGIGDAAVLLLLKDNSEEAKLKRQIAQATKMQAVGQLAGGVAHDFNNILTAILGHCDLMLMRHTPGDSDYDDIQQIKSNANRAAGLTRQLLAFSRQQTLRPQTLQLPDVVSEVSHLLKRLLGETVELKVKHGRELGAVRADPGQLEQVIVNLSVNARDAMAEKGGGTLTIQTYAVRADQVADIGSEILPVADYSCLSIADTGSGIPPSVLGKIFEPFFTTKEVGKGTGLGLSTVYGIVKQSGGFIFADSKVGEGTEFVIYLPVHEVGEQEAKQRAIKAPDEDSELWGSGTILLVEDEPMVRTVAQRALTRHGYEVLTATNGEEALEIIDKGEEIVLLVSDVVMPLMDGPTMGRKARETRPGMPILFMSGYAEEQLRKSIDIDQVDFLPKPFSVQELAEKVRSVLAKDGDE